MWCILSSCGSRHDRYGHSMAGMAPINHGGWRDDKIAAPQFFLNQLTFNYS